MRERVIETTQITKTYGKVLALDHVDICVKRGDIYGLIGDNGAGKSTLLKLLAGHSAASTGEIRLFGEQPDLSCGCRTMPCQKRDQAVLQTA